MLLGREVVLLTLLLVLLALVGCGGGGGSGPSANVELPIGSPSIPSGVNDSLSTIDELLEDLGL